MEYRHRVSIQKTNRVLFTSLLCIGLLITLYAFAGLDSSPDSQSRIEFNGHFYSAFVLVFLLLISFLLYKKWQAWFPYHIPIAITLAGFYYVFFFFTFTTGWIRMLGMLGFVLSIFIGTFVSILYFLFLLLHRHK